MKDCDICGGQGTIRLPVLTMSATGPDQIPAIVAASYREYPCPECGQLVDEKRVAIITKVSQFDSRATGDGFLDSIARQSAHALAEMLLKDDFLTVEIGREDSRQLLRQIRMTVGVVSKRVVASMEERIANRQEEMAREVVEEAQRQIDIWGRDYGAESLTKAQAKESVGEAMKMAVANRRDRK